MSQVHEDSELALEVFVLEPVPEGTEPEEDGDGAVREEDLPAAEPG